VDSSFFNEQFDRHGAWRAGFARQIKQLGRWMANNDLMDAAVEERLQRLEEQVRSDKVTIAFVAEFSRGKSELINAIFFAGYGRRIMPASAGRTTMCPTEMGYEPDTPPSLRLLSIETRTQPLGLTEWRLKSESWESVPLDMDNPQQMAQALEKVSQVRRVSVARARALGFWNDEADPDDNPTPDAAGMVEVPMWRHAIINIPHPLLRQGLVILDTPGLNAVGVEPELTINLIPQAQAVAFILGADTGVTRSDLAIWRDHLGGGSQGKAAESSDVTATHLVVLNKIDTLWDALSTPAQVQTQMERQQRTSAEMLGMPFERVVPVSAHKGLLAKINGDRTLLRASGLPQLERMLAEGIMGRRQTILRASVINGLAGLRAETSRLINIRHRELDEQMMELRSLRGKNATVIENMRQRIEQEQKEFDRSAVRIQTMRTMHLKMLGEIFQRLGPRGLKAELAALTEALQSRGLKLGVRKVYDETFRRLRAAIQTSQVSCTELQAMLGGTFRQLNTEFGFSLQIPAPPQLTAYEHDIMEIELRHVQYVGVGSTLRLVQPEFAERLARALMLRLRKVLEAAATELDLWSKSATSQLDAQLRERKRGFARRLDAVERIQEAAGGLDERIAHIQQAESHLGALEAQLEQMTAECVPPPQSMEPVQKAPPPPKPAPKPVAAEAKAPENTNTAPSTDTPAKPLLQFSFDIPV